MSQAQKTNASSINGQPLPPVPWLAKVAWGFGDLPISAYSIIKSMIIMAFLVNVLGIEPGIAGTLVFLIIIFDMITDPLVGWLSDMTSNRFGRRLPWIFTGALVLGVGLYGTFSPPAVLQGLQAGLWSFTWAVIATFGYTMITVPMNAMLSEITHDVNERSSLTAYRMAFSAIGILFAGGLFPLLAGVSRAAHSEAALLFALIFLVIIWVMVAGTLRLPRVLTRSETPVLESIKNVLAQRNYTLFVVYYAMQNFGIAMLTAGIPFATAYLILNQTPSSLAPIADQLGVQTVLFSFFVLGVLFSQPLWSALAQRFGKVRVMLLSSLGYVVILGAFYFMLPSQDVTPVLLAAIIVGIFNGAFLNLPWSLFPDIIYDAKLRSNIENDGMFTSLWMLGQKFANAFGPLVLGWIMQWNGWVKRDSLSTSYPEQPQSALAALSFSMTLMPALILLFSVLFLYFLMRKGTLQFDFASKHNPSE